MIRTGHRCYRLDILMLVMIIVSKKEKEKGSPREF